MIPYIYLALSVILLMTGHLMKLFRQKSFIEVYEKPDFSRLTLSLAVGYAINLVAPLHLGDIIRGWHYGKKSKNGFPFSIATVVIDRFWDVIAVTLIFVWMLLFDRHSHAIANTVIMYLIITGVIIAVAVLALFFTTLAKKCILFLAGIFNLRLEFKLLMFGWSVISSLKDVTRTMNRWIFALRTLLMWACYLLSYFFFSRCATILTGSFYTTGDILEQMFGDSAFTAASAMVMLRSDIALTVAYIIFFTAPLALLILISLLCRRLPSDSKESDSFVQLLPQMNEKDRLSFLQAYFSGSRRDYLDTYIKVNKNLSILRDCSAGSNATTLLCVDKSGRTFFRKYACGSDAEKLYEQMCWIKKYGGLLPLTEVSSEERGSSFFYYDMPCKSGAVDFFTFIHTSDIHKSEALLESVTDALGVLHNTESRPYSESELRKYISAKVTDNISLIMSSRELKPLMKYDTLIINGTSLPNLPYYLDVLSEEKLMKIFSCDRISETHGDLTIENIICCRDGEDDFYLIDPNPNSLHNTPFLDYSKLLQSLHGQYELMMKTAEVTVSRNTITYPFTGSSAYEKLFTYYLGCLRGKFSPEEVRSIFYHEIIHWLRLMPYKLKNCPQHAAMFYAGMLKVINEVVNLEIYASEAESSTV